MSVAQTSFSCKAGGNPSKCERQDFQAIACKRNPVRAIGQYCCDENEPEPPASSCSRQVFKSWTMSANSWAATAEELHPYSPGCRADMMYCCSNCSCAYITCMPRPLIPSTLRCQTSAMQSRRHTKPTCCKLACQRLCGPPPLPLINRE